MLGRYWSFVTRQASSSLPKSRTYRSLSGQRFNWGPNEWQNKFFRLSSRSLGGIRDFHSSNRVLQSKKDYYEVLGVSRDVDRKELKKRYRELAKKYHPDANKGDDSATERFQEISHAYEVLSDPDKRQAYDAYGPDFENMAGGEGGFQGFDGFENISELFMNQFGAGRRQHGADLDVGIRVSLTFMEAVKGCTRTVQYRVKNSCSACKGSGIKAGETKRSSTCKACNGRGSTVHNMASLFQVASECTACNGTGEVVQNSCSSCNGSGTESGMRKTDLKIPPGVYSGLSMAIHGEGNAAGAHSRRRKDRGTLTVHFNVEEDRYFKRSGENVHSKVVVSLAQAVMGSSVSIRTLDGEVELKIPSGVSNGEVRRLRNKGIKRLDGNGTGDHFVEFVIDMPKKLTKKQLELMKEFDEEEKKKRDS